MEQCPLCELEATIEKLGPLEDRTKVTCRRCGTFFLRGMAMYEIPSVRAQHLTHRLSAYTRGSSDQGTPREFSDRLIRELAESDPPVRGVAGKVERLLHIISKRLDSMGDYVAISADLDYPLAFARDGAEMEYLLEALVDQGLLQQNRYTVMNPEGAIDYRPTLSGWRKIEELTARSSRRTNQCFVAMWFDDAMLPVYRQGIVPGVERAGFVPVRIDQVEHTGKIDDRIIAEIRASSLLVADFTGQRNGVYFEAGFAMGLGLPVVWLCRDTDVDHLHFDTRQYNHIVWNADKLTDLSDRLSTRIRAIMPTTK